MVPLIAKMSYTYAGRYIREGDRFEAPTKDADLLKLTGRAMDPPAPPPKVRLLRTRDVKAQEEKDAAAEPELNEAGESGKRRYRRSDMVPEP